MIVTVKRGLNKEQVESFLLYDRFTFDLLRTFTYNNIIYNIRFTESYIHLILLNRNQTSNSGILATIKFK